MKKSLIALAVMAAAGAASAQSSVQLYGIADAYVGSVKTTTNRVGVSNSVVNSVVNSGGVDKSLFGLKGSEDLGGGLKAVFTLEQGFDLSNGAQQDPNTGLATTGQAFSREANVGVAGSFGEVRVGKVWSALDDVWADGQAVFNSALSAQNRVFKSYAYDINVNNAVKFTSNNYAGFSGAVSHSLGENKTTTLRASSNTALNVKYANGPIGAAFAYEIAKPQIGDSAKTALLNGSYDFGMAKLKGSYAHGTNYSVADDKVNEYQIGVDVPLASNLILSGNYAHSKSKNTADATTGKTNGFGLAAAYILSKRTMVYAGATQAKTKDAADVETAKTTIYALGVNHKF